MTTTAFADLLERTAALHRHLCPRQVLGVRIGLAGGRALGLDLPRADKRVLAIVETDGCAVDGISAATGCAVGRRTLRVVDFGKVAATFVDTHTGAAIRVVPRAGVRQAAREVAPNARNKWQAQLEGYQIMPEARLLSIQPVALSFSLEAVISRPGCRVDCDVCGEEVMNEREIVRDGLTLCPACAGASYYRLIGPDAAQPLESALPALFSPEVQPQDVPRR